MSMQLIVLTIAIVGLACLVQSTVGFGSALLAMPLLVPLIGLSVATPLVGLFSMTLGAIVLIMDHALVDLRSARWLIAASLVGVPVGLLLLRVLPESTMKLGLGALLIAYGGYSLASTRLPATNSKWVAIVFGFISGVLGGAYNTNGPPLVIYGTLRRWPPAQFRATLQGVFIFANVAILTGQALAGMWTWQVWQLFGGSMPAIFAAIVVGRWLNKRIPQQGFARIVYGLLIGLGLLLILR